MEIKKIRQKDENKEKEDDRRKGMKFQIKIDQNINSERMIIFCENQKLILN